MQVSDVLNSEAGYVQRECLTLSCEVLECCPWFEFADLTVYASSEEEDLGFSTDPDELDLDSGGVEHAEQVLEALRILLLCAPVE